MSDYTTPLTFKQVLVYLAGTAVFTGIAFGLSGYVYPWLGLPMVGMSGLAPFLLAWCLVIAVLMRFQVFRRNETLALVASALGAVVLGLLGLLALAHAFPS